MKAWALVGAVAVLFAATAFAQEAADTNMDILMQKVKADKKLLVATNMNLSDEEGKKFWPLYDGFQTELQQINQQMAKVIVAYAEAYQKGPVPNETAKKLLSDALAAEDAEVKLKRSYADKISKVLAPWKAARYIQIENKIRAAIKYELAAQIPLVY